MSTHLKTMHDVHGSKSITHLDRNQVEQIADSNDATYKALLSRFNLPAHYEFDASLYSVMLHLSENIRLTRPLRDWLFGRKNQQYCNATILRAYHHTEALRMAWDYRTSFDPVQLIDACGHYIKAGQIDTCLKLLDEFKLVSGNRNNFIRCLYYKTQAEAYFAQCNIKAALSSAETALEHNRQEKTLAPLLGELYLRDEQYAPALQWFDRSSLSEVQKRQEIKRIIGTLQGGSRICAVKRLLHLDAQKYSYLCALLPKKQR